MTECYFKKINHDMKYSFKITKIDAESDRTMQMFPISNVNSSMKVN